MKKSKYKYKTLINQINNSLISSICVGVLGLVFYKLTKLVSEELAKLDFEKGVLVHVVEL